MPLDVYMFIFSLRSNSAAITTVSCQRKPAATAQPTEAGVNVIKLFLSFAMFQNKLERLQCFPWPYI